MSETNAPVVVEVSLHDLLREGAQAMSEMSINNSHRRTLYKLLEAFKALAQRYIQQCDENQTLVRELEEALNAKGTEQEAETAKPGAVHAAGK